MRRAVQRYKSGKHLLKRLTDNPALATYIPTLAPATLNRAIQAIGVEDSAELIELSTPEQLVAILDDSIWRSDLPGAPESFQGQEFMRWLEAMLEISEPFCAERLAALGDDVLATAFSHFLQVGGPTMETPSSVEATEAYGTFVVWPKVEDEWDVLRAMLDSLDDNEPDLLQALLHRGRLATGHGRDAATAEMDAAFDHEIGREARGFVTPQSAQVFLGECRIAPLASLSAESAYDLSTARYFQLVEKANQQSARSPEEHAAEPTSTTEAQSTRPSSADDIADLEQTLGELEPLEIDREHPLLLSGPELSKQPTILQQALRALADSDPQALAQRLAETAYLSNILVSGTTLDEKHFSESQAATAVAATCNLGLDYLGGTENETAVANAPGMVRLFRVGWHLLQTLPLDVARKLITVTAAVDASASLRGWMVAEIQELLANDKFLKDVAGRQYKDVRETVDMFQLLISPAHAAEISALINDTPHLLKDVPENVAPDSTNAAAQFIETLDDLDHIDQLIAGIEHDFQEL